MWEQRGRERERGRREPRTVYAKNVNGQSTKNEQRVYIYIRAEGKKGETLGTLVCLYEIPTLHP